jgi:nucleoside-diphosphate-sugar epimerase
VLITGGAGFIGSVVGRSLAARGDRIRVLDNLSTGKRDAVPAGAEFFEADICDQTQLRRAAKDCDTIVHLAANCSVQFSLAKPTEDTRTNVEGTVAVLEAAAQAPTKPRVVFASSCAVYGDAEGHALEETAAPRPLSNYAVSKCAAELYCQSYAANRGIDTVVLRLFNVYGAGQRATGTFTAVIPTFCHAALRKKTLDLYGNGQQSRDFVHVDDVVRALMLACDRPSDFRGEIFNIGSGTATSIRTLARTMGAMLGRRLSFNEQPARAGEVMHSQAATAKAKRLLGFTPEVSLMEGLSCTLPSYMR